MISPFVVFVYLNYIELVVAFENDIPPLLEFTKIIDPVPNDLKFIVPAVVEFSKLKLPDRLKKLKFPVPPAYLSITGYSFTYPILNTPADDTPVVLLVQVEYEDVAFGL